MPDNVNHPKHYNSDKYECIDVMQEIYGIEAVKHFCECNAFKYIWRMNKKNGLEDAEKAIWYLKKYVELENLPVVIPTVTKKTIQCNGNIAQKE